MTASSVIVVAVVVVVVVVELRILFRSITELEQ